MGAVRGRTDDPRARLARGISPWPPDQCRGFLNLPRRFESHKNPNESQVTDLADQHYAQAKALDKFIRDGWRVRKEHPIYKWLGNEAQYKRIRELFERRSLSAAKGTRIGKPEAEFELMHAIVSSAIGDRYAAKDKRSRGPTGPNRRSAISHINALLKLESRGVSLPGPQGTSLRQLLITFRIHLQQTTRKRAGTPESKHTPVRYFAHQLNWTFDWRSPAAVVAFADLMGIECDERTAQRYSREAARITHDWSAEELARNQLAERLARLINPRATK